jgi:excisionase family DNA binding protein
METETVAVPGRCFVYFVWLAKYDIPLGVDSTSYLAHECQAMQKGQVMSQENLLEPVTNPREAEMAKVAQRCIMAALDHSRAPKIVLVEEGSDPEAAPKIELPPQALRAIADLLGLMGQQQPVMLMPQKHELTTQEAANFLNVSRPHVVKLIEQGALKHLKVGRHRRVEFQDLVVFQQQLQKESDDALQRLTDLSQELGLY